MASVADQAGETRRPCYVAYYRVSTGRQELSGLGLDAQREAVRTFLAAHPGRLVAEYSEALNGRKDNRPQLNEALRTANGFTIHILAAVAEYESNLNSQRMKAVFAGGERSSVCIAAIARIGWVGTVRRRAVEHAERTYRVGCCTTDIVGTAARGLASPVVLRLSIVLHRLPRPLSKPRRLRTHRARDHLYERTR